MGRAQNSGTQVAHFFRFLASRTFWIHLGLILLFFALCVFLTFQWLRYYTRHNESLELPDYTGYNLEEAMEDAREKSFRMQVLDSIHIVEKPGHEILNQHPPPHTLVKENRTIYVTVNKRNPDKIAISRLPVLYGKNYHRKKKELLQGFELRSQIIGRRYDPGEPHQILAVVYQGDTIIDRRRQRDDVLLEKGSTLEFIISERSGGRLRIPDLVCRTFAEARFLINNSGLTLGEVITDGKTEVVDDAWVSGQVPDPAEGFMVMGEEIKLSLSADKPLHCD